MDIDQYCRDLEAHLCRRNGGHLVRIAGPAFDLVRGWAVTGVPLKVAMQGIDRHVDRANAKGPRRRPIRIEFCEADVLDAFDAWRRAVGVRASAPDAGDAAAIGEQGDSGGVPPSPRHRARESLATHVDRVIIRLTALRASEVRPAWDAVLDEVVRRLDALHPASRRARGEAREKLVAELAALDARLTEAARASAAPAIVAAASQEADAELEPFRGRLSADAFASAHARASARALRERLHLPTLTFE